MNKRFILDTKGQTVNDLIDLESSQKAHKLLNETWINIFNTLSHQKETLKTINEKELLLYTCWPTVYNYAHIWNLRSYIFPDLLKRVARYSWYHVKQIINFTDVWHLTDDGDHWEDKMQKAVEREKKTSREIAAFYEENFVRDLQKLKITLPTEFVKATDLIEEQIAIIKDLETKWLVYQIEWDGIYMDTSKVPEYWKLVWKRHIDGLKSSARVEDVWKKNPTDFALWKFNVTGQKRDMERDSPRWVGFPGWHIECSAIAINKLWETIDVHTGWIDHIPIHHTNEIAQSESHTWKNFANYRLHWEFLNLEGDKKMSKSSWEFLHLAKLETLGYNPLVFKYLTYLTHYRKWMKFSIDLLQKATISYNNLKKRLRLKIENSGPSNASKRDYYYNKIFSSLLDDLNMPMALSFFQTMVKDNEISGNDVSFITQEFDKIAWLDLLLTEKTIFVPDEIKNMADDRQKAREERNRDEADKIRKRIINLWFMIKDTKNWYEIKKI